MTLNRNKGVSSRRLAVVLMATSVLLLSACSSVLPRNPAPSGTVDSAYIEGIPNARFWGDEISPHLEKEMTTLSREEIRQSFPALYGQPHNYLAISGGGANGAFGAGLLAGWTEMGDRPEFQMVTGISTGALIAPFAFLGPDYDHVLTKVYTSISTANILKKRSLISLLSADAFTDSTPLQNLLEEYIDEDIMAGIAREHLRGRGLYIGTTDLDYMRPMIWDIGAIAASGHPGSLELIRKILLASASIPGAMPPVRIEVQANGHSFDELHVDGGTATQVFVYPAATDWSKVLDLLDVPGRPTTWVIRNSSLEPYREVVEPKLGMIATRSISSLIRTQGLGDLVLIYVLMQRDGINYRLAYIPDDFDMKPEEPFDTAYMKELYKLANKKAIEGYPWEEKPPGLRIKILPTNQ